MSRPEADPGAWRAWSAGADAQLLAFFNDGELAELDHDDQDVGLPELMKALTHERRVTITIEPEE